MRANKTIVNEGTTINGVRINELAEKVEALKQDPPLAKFRFKLRNRWVDGGLNRSTVNEFHGVGRDFSRDEPFALEADEPAVLLGMDVAPNPVEYQLHALVACLTSSMVYHAAAEGIRIEAVEATVEGDLDIRGFMGITDEVRKGYQNIRVSFKVKSDASPKELERLARFSPVLDVTANGTNVSLKVETV